MATKHNRTEAQLMDFDPARLRPDVWTDTAVLSNGKKITIYRCPYPTEGPIQTTNPHGQPELRFMYAHYVFTWPKTSTTIDVSHGTLHQHHPLWPNQPITGRWSSYTLTHYARTWTHAHLRRFTTNGAHP